VSGHGRSSPLGVCVGVKSVAQEGAPIRSGARGRRDDGGPKSLRAYEAPSRGSDGASSCRTNSLSVMPSALAIRAADGIVAAWAPRSMPARYDGSSLGTRPATVSRVSPRASRADRTAWPNAAAIGSDVVRGGTPDVRSAGQGRRVSNPATVVPREQISSRTAESSTRTLGIDLASQPKRTAACVIEWRPGGAELIAVDQLLDNPTLLELMRGPSVTKIGIDAPFGWPAEFVDAIAAYRTLGTWPVKDRTRLYLRETDRAVRAICRQNPLSVTTDRIAFAAMRCAELLTEYSTATGRPLDRSGAGVVVEVYPAAALRQWEISPAAWATDKGGYKGHGPTTEAARRARLVDLVAERLRGTLDIPPSFLERCYASDDVLDALICALVARAVEAAKSLPISDSVAVAPKALQAAAEEGWIHLPLAGSLSGDLARAAG